MGFPLGNMREGLCEGSEHGEACSSREPMGGALLGWRSSPLLWCLSLALEDMSWCQGLVGVRQGADTPLF